MFSALRMVTLVEVLVALVVVAAGLCVLGMGYALSALREIALNTRTSAFGPNRPVAPTYETLDMMASVLVGVGAVVALVGVVSAFWLFLA